MVREGLLQEGRPGKREEEAEASAQIDNIRGQNKDSVLRVKILVDYSISRRANRSKQNSSKPIIWHRLYLRAAGDPF